MGKLTSVLASAQLMDTTPFIYYFEQHLLYFPLVKEIVDHAEDSSARLCTSSLTLLETTVFPLRNNRADLVQQYRKVLMETDYLQLIELSIPVITIATELRAKYNLRTPDALQVGACIYNRCDIFITNDKTLKRIQEIAIVVLDDYVYTAVGQDL